MNGDDDDVRGGGSVCDFNLLLAKSEADVESIYVSLLIPSVTSFFPGPLLLAGSTFEVCLNFLIADGGKRQPSKKTA